jgi:hypothetical protein
MTTLTKATAADLASQLIIGAVTDGGATLPVVPGSTVPTRGYIVGGAAPGLVLALDSPTVDVDAAAWVTRSLPRAALPGHYLGSWIGPDGRLYLDVVESVSDRADAVALGRARGEYSVWSLADSAEILCASDLLVTGA